MPQLCLLLLAAAPWVARADDAAEELRVLLEGVEEVMRGADTAAAEELLSEQQPAGDPMVLDLRRCVVTALERNTQPLVAEAELKQQRARTGQARSARLPQLKANVLLAYEDREDEALDWEDSNDEDIEDFQEAYPEMAGGIGALVEQINEFQPEEESRTVQFSLEQVLFAGGQLRAAVRASKFLEASQEWRLQAALDQVAFEAKQAFHDCLLTKALLVVAYDSVTTFERHLEDAQRMLDVGMVSRLEVLRAETELAARRTGLVSAQSAATLALMNLRRILALSQDTPVTLTGDLAWAPLGEPVEALSAEAIANRAELHALDRAIDAAHQELAARRGGYLPKAAATVQWQDYDGGGTLVTSGWRFSVGATWDLYTGGRRKHERFEARARIEGLEYQRADVARLVELDVRQAYVRAREAIAKVRREKGALTLAREGKRLAELRFKEGVGTQVETMDANLAMTQAQTLLAQALRDYAVAIASIEKAAGRRWFDEETTPAE